jgi:mRNA interferase HicA
LTGTALWGTLRGAVFGYNIGVAKKHFCYSHSSANSKQFKRWLSRKRCAFEAGKGGHLIVRRGSLWSVLPMHGGRKQLGTGLIAKIKKDLGLRGARL